MTTQVVSTEDTLKGQNDMVLTTEEHQAPEAPKAKAEPSSDGESQTTDSAADSKTSDKPRRNRRAERDIRKLKNRLRTAEHAAAESASQVITLEQTVSTLETKIGTVPEPKLSDFETSREYATAVRAWEDDQKPAAPANATPAKKPDPAPVIDENPYKVELEELTESGKEKYGDKFEKVFGSKDLVLSKDMAEFAFDSDKGPELIMYFDEHEEEARALYMSDTGTVNRSLAKIEAGLTEAKVKENKVEEADEVPETISTSAPKVTKDLESMDMSDYAKTRRAQEKEDRIR